jgi:hypothetical protein
MKLTKSKLKQIIQEELSAVLSELEETGKFKVVDENDKAKSKCLTKDQAEAKRDELGSDNHKVIGCKPGEGPITEATPAGLKKVLSDPTLFQKLSQPQTEGDISTTEEYGDLTALEVQDVLEEEQKGNLGALQRFDGDQITTYTIQYKKPWSWQAPAGEPTEVPEEKPKDPWQAGTTQ